MINENLIKGAKLQSLEECLIHQLIHSTLTRCSGYRKDIVLVLEKLHFHREVIYIYSVINCGRKRDIIRYVKKLR